MEVKNLKLSNIITEHAINNPSGIAFGFMGKTATYLEVAGLVEIYAAKFLKLGIKKGDHVALWAINSIPWFVAFAALEKLGAVATLMNYGLKREDIKSLLEFTDVKYILYGTNRETNANPDVAYELADELKIDRDKVVNIEKVDFVPITDEEREEIKKCDESVESKDSTIIIFTSGTSALPKGVLLSQYAILNNGVNGSEFLSERFGENICLAIPMFHSFGLMVGLMYFLNGKTIYLPEQFKPDIILSIVNDNNVETMASVGAVYLSLLEHKDFEEKVAPRLHMCIIGGGLSTPVQMLRLETSFKDTKFINGYGQTEAAPIIAVPVPSDSLDKRSTTVGKPIPNVEVKIFDSNKGFLPDGEIGEVIVKGYNLMNGYYKLPEEEQAIDKDGWLHTGDLGFIDEEGYLNLAGRSKDIIIRAGENISPSEIEKEMTSVESVRDVKVMGAPHHIFGESVEACLTIKPGYEFNESEMRKTLKEKLSTIKVPSHFFIYDSFPLNENGKLDQRALKADMFKRVREINISEALNEGMRVINNIIKNTSYNIVPTAAMVSSLAESIGFSKARASKIRLAVEEMLQERINNAYEDSGDISVSVMFMPEYMRIQFVDDGKPYYIEENEESSLSAKIILKVVDSFQTLKQNEKLVYAMDFIYENDFNMVEFLSNH